jgi:hypothetical protein
VESIVGSATLTTKKSTMGRNAPSKSTAMPAGPIVGRSLAGATGRVSERGRAVVMSSMVERAPTWYQGSVYPGSAATWQAPGPSGTIGA